MNIHVNLTMIQSNNEKKILSDYEVLFGENILTDSCSCRAYFFFSLFNEADFTWYREKRANP